MNWWNTAPCCHWTPVSKNVVSSQPAFHPCAQPTRCAGILTSICLRSPFCLITCSALKPWKNRCACSKPMSRRRHCHPSTIDRNGTSPGSSTSLIALYEAYPTRSASVIRPSPLPRASWLGLLLGVCLLLGGASHADPAVPADPADGILMAWRESFICE